MTEIAAPRVSPATAPLPIFRRWLIDGWRGLIGWALGCAAVVGLYLPLYPAMRSPELLSLLDSLPPELVRTLGYDDITTGSGYVQATFFGLIGFVLIAIAATGWGAAAIGGAEESGRLELVLSHAVGRARYTLESALALLVKLIALGAVVWGLIWVLDEPAELDLDAAGLLAVTLAWMGIGALCATVALAVGALSGRRLWSIGAGAAVAVAGYVLQAVANNSEELDRLRMLSPYEWAYGANPLAAGFDGGGLALLWGGSALFTLVAVIALSRRDVLG